MSSRTAVVAHERSDYSRSRDHGRGIAPRPIDRNGSTEPVGPWAIPGASGVRIGRGKRDVPSQPLLCSGENELPSATAVSTGRRENYDTRSGTRPERTQTAARGDRPSNTTATAGTARTARRARTAESARAATAATAAATVDPALATVDPAPATVDPAPATAATATAANATAAVDADSPSRSAGTARRPTAGGTRPATAGGPTAGPLHERRDHRVAGIDAGLARGGNAVQRTAWETADGPTGAGPRAPTGVG